MGCRVIPGSRPRVLRGRLLGAALALAVATAAASPHVPARDDEVLATLPAGVTHLSNAARQQASARLDVAVPLAQFYIKQARATGDLRFLGYADAALTPWLDHTPQIPAVLVLKATVLQSRHAFGDALIELDRALALRPDDAQAWLTRATVLRVLGRYTDATASCMHLSVADLAAAQICLQSVRSLDGQLAPAYAAVRQLSPAMLSNETRAWRCSELGEMAMRLGDVPAAERWFAQGLATAPDDVYTRAAYADLLLAQRRAPEALEVLRGYESMEPMLLRIALAQQQLGDARLAQTSALLANAFSVEEQRGEAVHRREQARFLLDVAHDPAAALEAARENWRVQREPADILILLRAADAARRPQAAADALTFVRLHRMQDARFAANGEAAG